MDYQLRRFWDSDTSLSILLWILGLTIFVILPTLVLLGAPEWERALGAVVFTALVASGIMTVWRMPEARRFLFMIAGVPLVLLWVEIAYHPPIVSLFTGGVRMLLVALFTTVLFVRVVAPGPITRARIKGAIAVYLLIGLLFAEAYRLLCIGIPGAISVHASNSLSVKFTAELMYFSFSTMTTAGYGDIVPVHPLARSLANLEAITGQMYMVLLIGRLLTLHMSQVEERAEERQEELAEELRTTEPRRPIQKG
jgi:hypothetical protein